MGFFSALIIGPCVTTPLGAALVYIGQSGDALLGGLSLFVMSLGMGVPLLLIGVGTGKYLPKAGAWMVTLNRVFGVIMLSLAIYMLSRILDESLILFIWGVWSLSVGFFLWKKESETRLEKMQKTVSFMLILYGTTLFIGALGGATHLLKPFEPFMQKKEKRVFQTTKSLDEIRSEEKVILYFTARWCVNCKKFKQETLANEKILTRLNSYRFVEVDLTESPKDILKHFSVIGPPTLLFYEKGKRKKNLLGYLSIEAFEKELNH